MYILEGKQKRKAVEITCEYCKKKVLRRKYKNRTLRFCSHRCSHAAKKLTRVIVKCSTCSKEFERLPSRIKRSKSGLQFCSMKCKAKAQSLNGIIEMLPAHYGTGKHDTSYRRVALEAYPHKCVDCSYDELEVLVVHHLDRDRKNANVDNLVILCRNCHYKRHLYKPT